VTVLAASGDSGAADVKFDQSTYYLHPVTSWPDSDPLVTGVGGTQLRDTAKHGWRSVVWNDTYNVPRSSTSSAARARTRWLAGAGSP